MRVYVPTTSTGLRQLDADGALAASPQDPLTAFAVTPALREWYVSDPAEDAAAAAEDLEYAALSEAARGSLRLIDAEPDAARRRVVVAADVPDADMEVRDDLDRGVVRISAPVPLVAVASVHVDGAEAEATVAAAADAMIAADLGDERSREATDDAEGFELSWYANQEIADVIAGL